MDFATYTDASVKNLARLREHCEHVTEAVADIAYQAGVARYYSGDSRADIAQFIAWAQEFEKLLVYDKDGNETYNGKDYMTAIEEFTLAKWAPANHQP